MKPTISIIAPTFNHEGLIAQCLDSIVNQTYKNWELILIDDASDDKTSEVITKYATVDPRIRYIRHEKRWGALRLVDTYNQALDLCQGDYIAIIEGDDYWPLDKLSRQLSVMQSNSNVVLSYGINAQDLEGKVKTFNPKWPKSILNNRPKGNILNAFLFGESPILAQSVMIKRESLILIGGFYPKEKTIFLIDYPTWMELALIGDFYYIPEVLGYWRRHPKQITEKQNDALFENQYRYIKDYINRHSVTNTSVSHNFFGKRPGFIIFLNLCWISLKKKDFIDFNKHLKHLTTADLSAYLFIRFLPDLCRLTLRAIYLYFMEFLKKDRESIQANRGRLDQ